MAEKKIVKKEPVKEKVEYKSETPAGFVHCIVLKDYEDKKKGDELFLVERRFKSLALRGYVK
jgi:hypothetical protein